MVAVKGNIVLSEGFGWADREKEIPITASSVSNIGSVTKQFTASAIIKLVEQAKINTSDNLIKFFPEVAENKKEITVHQLLTHTSGISPGTGGFRYDEATKDQFLKDFFDSKLLTPPGSKHRYANTNYIMLAAIIEKVSGQDYETFLTENLWRPAGLQNSGYKHTNYKSKQLAHGYYFDISEASWKDWGTTREHLPKTENHWYSIGKGDIQSTVEDLYKWHLALEANSVLDAESRKMLESPFTPENEDGTSFYGYGWAISHTSRGTKIITHNGSNGIYFANFIRFVEDNVVVIVLSNTILNPDSENVAWEIGRMVFNLDYKPKPVSKLSYELVYDYTQTNTPENAKKLVPYLEEKLNGKLNDKALFNRLGFKMRAKENKTGWGLELLKLNVQLFPDDGNLWDSLGDAYFNYQQNTNAIKSFQKALELCNKPDCHWRENSESKLRKLTSKL
nr:serine hydrolase domain-containing protein [Maribellus maritimus]